MPYAADDINTPRKSQVNGGQLPVPVQTSRSENNERLNKDIVKQVDHWMRNKPLSDGFMCSVTPRVSYSPTLGRPLPRERDRRRHYKRHRAGRFDIHDSSIASQESDSSQNFDPLRDTLRRRRKYIDVENSKQTKISETPRGFGDARRADKDKDKRSVFGTVHNEIEFQKRYRRMFDLNKHLQFVNSTNGLKGHRIASKKMHHLPPMSQKQFQGLEQSEMFAIQTVTQSNAPDGKGGGSPKTVWKNVTVDNSLLSFDIDSSLEETSSNLSKLSVSQTQSDLAKFEKLPKITTQGQKFQNDTDVGIHSPESNTSSEREKDSKSRLTGSKSQCNNADDEMSDMSDDEPYAVVQEMKVTINIRYKPEDDRPTKVSRVKARHRSSNRKPRNKSEDIYHLSTDDKNNVNKRFQSPTKYGSGFDEYLNVSPFDKYKRDISSVSPSLRLMKNDVRMLAE